MVERKQDELADHEISSEEQKDRRQEAGAAPPRGRSEAAGAFGNAGHDDNIKRGPAGTGQGGGGGVAEIEVDQLAGASEGGLKTARSSDAPPSQSDEVRPDRASEPDLTGRSEGHKSEEELRRSGRQP